MFELTNVTLENDYADAQGRPVAALGPITSASRLILKVYNNPATVTPYRMAPEAGVRDPAPLPEVTLQPGVYDWPGVVGFKARNAAPNYPSVVYATLLDRWDPPVTGGLPTGQIVSSTADGAPTMVNQPETIFGPVLALGINQFTGTTSWGPFPMRGFRSTVVDLDTSGPVLVTLTWEMSDNPGLPQTTFSYTSDTGKSFSVIRNQGDVLVDLTIAAGAETYDASFLGSNFDPLASGGAPPGCAIFYNILNGVPPRCHGWLDVLADTHNPSTGWGIHLNDDSGVDGMMLEAEERVTIRDQDDQAKIIVHDDAGGVTVYSNNNGQWFDDRLQADRTTNPNNGVGFYTPKDFTATAKANVIFNLAPASGKDWRIVQQEHAYVVEGDDTADSYVDETHYLNGGNFRVYAAVTSDPGKTGNAGDVRLVTAGENSGGEGDAGNIVLDARADVATNVPGTVDVDAGVLDVETTYDDGSGVGIRLHDTGASGGVDISSDNGNVAVGASAGQVNLGSPGAFMSLGATNSSLQILNLGDTFIIYDSGGSPLVTYTG